MAISIYNTVYSQYNDSCIFTSASKFNMFREQSYISPQGGIGNIEPLVFEANITPYYSLFLNTDYKWGIELSPQFIFRMYNKDSYPIRTPSFIPKITFFNHIIDNYDYNHDWFTYISVCHHSNGQDGSFFNSGKADINTFDGDFSTNYLEGGIFLSRFDKRRPFIINYLKLSLAYYFNQNSGLEKMYGKARLFSEYQTSFDFLGLFKQKKNNLSQKIKLEWIAGDIEGINSLDFKKRFIFSYTVSYKPAFLKDFALFSQFYYGQDYYNIYFNHTISVLRFGISAKTLLIIK